jgi:hypothetical protein
MTKRNPSTVSPDFDVVNHGTIMTFRPLTEAAQQWWDDNVDPDAMSLGGAYAVEPRHAFDIAEGILEEGMTIQ